MAQPSQRDTYTAQLISPGTPEDPPSPGIGPATRRIRRTESELQRRVEFEALVSRLTGIFVGLRSEDLDWGVHEALRQMGEYLRVDHCNVCVVHTHGQLMDHRYAWTARGTPSPWAGRVNIPLDRYLPWAANRLRRLDGIAVYSVETLDSEAAVDQATLRDAGVKSVILLPMAVQGEMVGFIGLDSTTSEMTWSDDAISLLKLMATIVGEALERKRIEEQLRSEHEFTNALLSAAGAIIIVTDIEGNIVRFNAAAEALTGYSAAEAVGQSPWDLFVASDERASGRRIFRKVAAGAPPHAHEGSLISREGERHTISWSTTSIAGGDGVVSYVIMSGIDVSETKRLEAEVLNVAEREQSRIGHDLHDGLGQTLAGIEFMSHVLQQRLANQSRPEAAEMEEITTLIRDAIRTTRDLARGLSPVLLQSKGLSIALNDLAESTTRQLRGVRCISESDPRAPDAPPEIAIHLYRIAQEAVNNAVRHGKATLITISLRLVDHLVMEVSVEDNGRGFPDDFDYGTGMGLRVMQYRASIIRGALQLSQRPGEGVCVSCTVDSSRFPLKGVG